MSEVLYQNIDLFRERTYGCCPYISIIHVHKQTTRIVLEDQIISSCEDVFYRHAFFCNAENIRLIENTCEIRHVGNEFSPHKQIESDCPEYYYFPGFTFRSIGFFLTREYS